MKKALIIGCGRIGAQCDILGDVGSSCPHAYSHAKALSDTGAFDLYFYDLDTERSLIAASYFRGTMLESLNDGVLLKPDWLSIASPTESHVDIYKLFAGSVPIVLMEKPISYDESDLRIAIDIYKRSGQKTYVNYFRNFLPQYARLKALIQELELNDPFKEIQITYHRGLINNGSHALSCASYLLNHIVCISDQRVFSVKGFNQIVCDPSISFSFRDRERDFIFAGLDEKDYPILELKLYSRTHVVKITDSGDTLQVFRKTSNDIHGILMESVFYENRVLENCIGKAVNAILEDADTCRLAENFIESCELNQELLRVCLNLQ
ncbi:MAG TPA: Gfo/Idh/MocA family oxidoreductase [Oligoflexia bacterium]|nr:Gfo/Idh/MocA family oxidoreductase [Oligoflexia bacterium]HMP48503.1 Gfo/Idh/MocA family oxidoreductase [Oligoflexia bacterium]